MEQVQGTIGAMKPLDGGKVRVAIEFSGPGPVTGNINKLMTAKDAKAEGYFPGEAVIVGMEVKIQKVAPASKP